MNESDIRRIVGRCHVSESNRRVIRYFISKLRNGHAAFRAIPRQQRHFLMRQVITVHKANQNLYLKVMRRIF
jgi:hypothetical protein